MSFFGSSDFWNARTLQETHRYAFGSARQREDRLARLVGRAKADHKKIVVVVHHLLCRWTALVHGRVRKADLLCHIRGKFVDEALLLRLRCLGFRARRYHFALGDPIQADLSSNIKTDAPPVAKFRGSATTECPVGEPRAA